MLDLRQAERFMEGFYIRSRGQNRPVPFRANPSQQKITQKLIDHCDKGNRAYVIFLKARRVGVTTYLRMLAQTHLLEKKHADAIIMAQLKPVASSIYQDSVKLARQLPIAAASWKPTQSETNFFNIPSRLSWNTANSVIGTRGLAYTHLHATEAAYYENPEVFTAVLSTLSDDPENMAFIETTANGTEGPGQAYHEYWEAAMAGDNEFLPIFLPWWEDPEYVRDPKEARDAPRDDYENYLMRELKLGKDRIAFYRFIMANKCSGRLEQWRREYPGTPEEAFEVTGVPVFDFEDTTAVAAGVREPFDRIEIEVKKGANGLRTRLEQHEHARFHIYEKPQRAAHYFMGVTIGRGSGPDDEDTLTMVMWNGETGRLAARFADKLYANNASDLVCGLGVLYNRAMIAVDEGNGGFGAQINQELRDRWRYPNPYRWKGRNDRVTVEVTSKTMGFTINEYTRKMLLNGFIASLKRNEVVPVDEMFAEQMKTAQWEGVYPYEAIAGEDDVFWAGMVGWIAKTQYHPKRCEDYTPYQDLELLDDAVNGIKHQKSPFSTSIFRGEYLEDSGTEGFTLQKHIEERDRREREHYAKQN